MEKPGNTEENLQKEFLSQEEKHNLDFMKFAELTDYSDIGSHQLTSLVKQYKFRRANAVRLLHEELDSLSKQRQETEEILQEHHFVEKNQISVSDEGYDIWGVPDLERAKKATLLYKNEIDVGVNVTGEDSTVGYWKERAVQLERLLEDSLKRENILVQKLQECAKMEEQKLPVEELSRILKRADNFLHFILQNAPIVIAHQDKDLRYRFIYNHFPSLGEEDVIGKTDEEILLGSEGVKEFVDFKREVLENGKPVKREITYAIPLFGKKTFLTYVEPVFNKKQEIIGINYMGFDVTDQVVKREKLTKYREEMAVQKAKETELLKTIHVTEERMRAKQMLAAVSREIRSPLTGVVGMAEILANTNVDMEQRQLLDIIISSGDLVLQLISDILDLSKVESGMLSRKGKEKEASSSGSKHPLCDRNAYIKPPQRPEDRPVIRRVGYRSFVGDLLIVTKNVNKIISQCARFHYPEGTRLPTIDVCTKFDDYPEGTKKEVQDEFLKHFQFPPGEDMDLAWKTFSSIANKALQNLLNKCRDEAKDRYGDNILEWKDRGVPSTYDWITANNWPKLCDYWCTEGFARRSEQNQQNRTSSREGSFATTGLVNMLVYKQRFENENQHEPRWFNELFTLTHTNKKKGQFCFASAKKAQEDYDRDMSAKYGSDRALWPSFDADIWYGNIDNNAHGDNYGLSAIGKTRSLYRPGGFQTTSSQSQSQSYSSAPPPLRQEDINAISSQVLAVLQPQINQFMEELRRSVRHSSSHQGGSSSHHASKPDAQDDSGDDMGDDYI